jgi:hypothetical protein
MTGADTFLLEQPLRTRMTRQEILERLQSIRDKGNEALRLLESNPLSPEAKIEIQSLAHWIKEELQAEYTRLLPERVRKTLTIFEMSLYSPTIEEAWKHTGIGRLKTHGVPDQKWREPLEAVVYKAACTFLNSSSSSSIHQSNLTVSAKSSPQARSVASFAK